MGWCRSPWAARGTWGGGAIKVVVIGAKPSWVAAAAAVHHCLRRAGWRRAVGKFASHLSSRPSCPAAPEQPKGVCRALVLVRVQCHLGTELQHSWCMPSPRCACCDIITIRTCSSNRRNRFLPWLHPPTHAPTRTPTHTYEMQVRQANTHLHHRMLVECGVEHAFVRQPCPGQRVQQALPKGAERGRLARPSARLDPKGSRPKGGREAQGRGGGGAPVTLCAEAAGGGGEGGHCCTLVRTV